MVRIAITAISDNVCPHCYLGLIRLHRALALYRKVIPGGSRDTITTTWHAYQLDQNATPVGHSTPISAKMVERFGAEKAPDAMQRLTKLGLREGLHFTMDSRLGNTRDSHRVFVLARSKGDEVANAVVRETMRLYFEESGDITSHEDLIRAATRGGLDEAETRAWLESDQGGEEVDREVQEAREKGIDGVPRFIINDMFVVDGAQDPTVFLGQLLLAKQAAEGESIAV